MPSGYTDCVQSGKVTAFSDFLWSCVSAFDIRAREGNYQPTMRTVDPYYSDKLKEATEEYQKLIALDDFGKFAYAEQKKSERLQYIKDAESKSDSVSVKRARYEKMLDAVYAWQPPTEDHVGIKNFMVQQLTESIAWDCSGEEDYWEEEWKKLVAKTPQEIYEERVTTLQNNIDYYKKHHDEEVKGVKDFNNWLKAIVDSVGPPKLKKE